MIKVLIADDHVIVRKGLRDILRSEHDLVVAGEASHGLDITMPGASGVEVLKRIKHAQPALPVIMLSMHANPAIVRGCFDLGANGYVVKEAAPEELVLAIRTALDGQVYVCHALRDTLNGG